jgi:DNA repair protein RecO (recombination protein O)
MEEKSSGIILRTRPLTESSLIVHWLTPELGRLSTVAKGARRQKSAFAGKLDLFFQGEFSFRRSRRSDLHTLAEVGIRECHPNLRRELGALQRASYFVRLIELTTETETPLPGVFQLLKEALAALPSLSAGELAVLTFELKLLDELGLTPDLAASPLTPGARKVLECLSTSDWTRLPALQLSSSQRSEIARFLSTFLQFHIGRIPPGRENALR